MIIAVDFDGTLCEYRCPEIGEEKKKVVEWVKGKKEEGSGIILWTCREGESLQKAIDWCIIRGIVFDAINQNVPSLQNKSYAIRKVYADIYLDDKNLLITYIELGGS